MKVITSGGVTYRGAAYHRECFTCTNCTKTLAGQRFTSREELPYCADCFAQLFSKRCNACSKPITGNRAVKCWKRTETLKTKLSELAPQKRS